jgi:hypothetical protein
VVSPSVPEFDPNPVLKKLRHPVPDKPQADGVTQGSWLRSLSLAARAAEAPESFNNFPLCNLSSPKHQTFPAERSSHPANSPRYTRLLLRHSSIPRSPTARILDPSTSADSTLLTRPSIELSATAVADRFHSRRFPATNRKASPVNHLRLEGRRKRQQLQEALQIAILLERERKTREFAVSFKASKTAFHSEGAEPWSGLERGIERSKKHSDSCSLTRLPAQSCVLTLSSLQRASPLPSVIIVARDRNVRMIRSLFPVIVLFDSYSFLFLLFPLLAGLFTRRGPPGTTSSAA